MKETLTSVLDLTENLSNVETLYGMQDLASSTLFAGGFINFGYWKGINLKRQISKKARIASSQNLYKKISELLSINKDDAVIEIGCGLGNGTFFFHKKYKPKFIIGIDSSSDQIQRAVENHCQYLAAHKDSIRFVVCSAENILLKPGSISKAFSVEAMQHFSNVDDFLETVFSALQSKGKLAIATFFFKKNPPKGFINLFPNFEKGIDKIIKLNEFNSKLLRHGFCEVKYQSIGKDVWFGFDKWISQTEYKDTWDKNWLWAYKEGIIDYYIFEARKP